MLYRTYTYPGQLREIYSTCCGIMTHLLDYISINIFTLICRYLSECYNVLFHDCLHILYNGILYHYINVYIFFNKFFVCIKISWFVKYMRGLNTKDRCFGIRNITIYPQIVTNL